MSLEKAISDLTDAVKELTKEMQNAATSPAPVEGEKPTPKKAKKAAPRKKEPAEDDTAEEEDAAEAIDYEVLKAKTLELVKEKGRDAALTTLQKFGKNNKKATDLKPEQYAGYLKEVEKLLGDDDLA